MKHLIFLLSILVPLTFSFASKADIFISKKQGIILPPIGTMVPAGQIKWFPLSGENQEQNSSNQYEIVVTVTSTFPDIGAYVCDETNLNYMINKKNFECIGISKGRKTFKFEAKAYGSGKLYLVFNNHHSLVTRKYVNAHVYLTAELSESEQKSFKENFEKMVEGIHEELNVPNFDVSLAPCKTENAFSTTKGGHITMCSELLYSAILDNNQKAFAPVFLHELGHTVLNLWGDPSYQNEKTADEFAVAVLLMQNNGESYIYDWINWFKQHQYLQGEVAAMLSGDQHPLTAQRIASIEQILASRGDFERRWANLLYPHMTDKALSEIVIKPYAGANIELAEKILEERKNKN